MRLNIFKRMVCMVFGAGALMVWARPAAETTISLVTMFEAAMPFDSVSCALKMQVPTPVKVRVLATTAQIAALFVV